MVMPWAVKKAIARRRNPAAVTARSSGRDCVNAIRVWASIAECQYR